MARVNISQAEKARAQEVRRGASERSFERKKSIRASRAASLLLRFFRRTRTSKERKRRRQFVRLDWGLLLLLSRARLCLLSLSPRGSEKLFACSQWEWGAGKRRSRNRERGTGRQCSFRHALFEREHSFFFSSWRHLCRDPFEQQLRPRMSFVSSALDPTLERFILCFQTNLNESKRMSLGSATRRFRMLTAILPLPRKKTCSAPPARRRHPSRCGRGWAQGRGPGER